ncbi:hypothetical protein [Shewanella indica]|uniref:hypothetical protein n=1 Tax=Shewanella indica TaxID=768528 RepID=UPI0030074D20
MNEDKPIVAAGLAHLTEEQIDVLYERYLGDEKVKDLIAEYGISCQPSGLAKLFPPKMLIDEFCPHCEGQVYELRRSKSDKSFGTSLKCLSCGHTENTERNIKCSCESCVSERERRSREAQQKWEEERKAIQASIREKHCLDEFKPIHIDTLSLREKVLLLSLMTGLGCESLAVIEPLRSELKGEPIASTPEAGVAILSDLYRAKIILVNPDSAVSAFIAEKDYEDFYVREVSWVVNVTLGASNNKRASPVDVMRSLRSLLKAGISENDRAELLDLMTKTALGEVIHGIDYWAKDHLVAFTPGPKTTEVILQLIPDFTVSQLCYFAKLAMKDVCVYEKKPGVSKRQAANIIPSKLLELGTRARNRWQRFENYPRPRGMPRTHVSRVVFDWILGTDDGGFTMLQHEFEIRTIESVADESDYKCIRCDCDSFSVINYDGWVERECSECGYVS